MSKEEKKSNSRFLPEGKGRQEVFLTHDTLKVYDMLAAADNRSRKQFIEILLEKYARENAPADQSDRTH